MTVARPQWSAVTKIVISLLLLALGIFLLNRFSIILKPLILAIILAYVLTPLASLIQQRLHLRRGLAVLICYVLLLVILSLIPLVIIPPLLEQSQGLNVNIQRYTTEAERILSQTVMVAGFPLNLDVVFQQITGSVQGILQPVFSQTLGIAVEVISSLVWVVFILVVGFYLTKDGETLHAWFEGLVPPDFLSDYVRLRSEINSIWSAFFRGQLLLAMVVTGIFTVVGLIIGMPFVLTMAVLAGLLEFLPSLGHGIWFVIASLLALFAGSTWLPIPHWAFMLLVIGLHLFYQQFDLNYLIPRIIGRSVHLPPLVVILGIFSGAMLAGVLGVVLAAPTIASARVIGRYIYANLADLEPFPESVTRPLPPPNARWWRRPTSQPLSNPPSSSEIP